MHLDHLQGVIVRNYANQGAVNGPVSGTSGVAGSIMELRAIPDPNAPPPNNPKGSKLLVGPPASLTLSAAGSRPRAAAGPYWIVATGGWVLGMLCSNCSRRGLVPM